MTVAVLGAGNWGTTLALLLASNGHKVRLWEFNETLAHDMLTHRENRTYLPGYRIPDEVLVTDVLGEALDGAGMVCFVVPSTVMRKTARAVAVSGKLGKKTVLVSLSKGLEFDTLNTMTDEIAEELPDHTTVALSGPCIASEVAKHLPTTIVAASNDEKAARSVQDTFMTPVFRVYTSGDPRGVQLGGALKNIIAIAAGINDGLGLGSNAKAALMTRGIVEMTRFGMLQGAKPDTFNGLSGIGDLMTTCMSPHSRNRRVGVELASGRSLGEILQEMVMVAEGVPTTQAVWEYSLAHGIDMPITGQVYGVLFGNVPPAEAVGELMSRERKSE